MNQKFPIYRVVVAWAIILLVLWGVAKTKIGYQVLFYLVLLTIVILVGINYKALVGLVKPASAGEGL